MGGIRRKKYAIFSDLEAIRAQIEAARERSGLKDDFTLEDQEELTQIIRSMQHDSELLGTPNLGLDGVLRILSVDREVIDAVALPRRLCKAMLDRFPWDQQIEDDFRGVDGMKVPKRMWFNPSPSLLPPPMTEEQRIETTRRLRDTQEMLGDRKVMLQDSSSLRQRRRPLVISNYDLEPQ